MIEETTVQAHFKAIKNANGGPINYRLNPVVPALVALDYLDGIQIPYLEQILSDPISGMKKWKERGIRPVMENITAKIVKRSALTYQDDPERFLQRGDTTLKAETAKYKEILQLSGFPEIARELDKVVRLLKAALVLVMWSDEGKCFIYSILHRGNCDVQFDKRTGEILSLLYQTQHPLDTTGKKSQFVYIDKEEIRLYESDGATLKAMGEPEANPYGIVPVAHIYDESIPRAGFWPKEAWQELIQLNEAINLFNTQVFLGAKWQALGTAVTNVKLADGTIVAPDAPIILEDPSGADDKVFFEFKTPSINVAEFVDVISGMCARVADGWGVNLKAANGGGKDVAESGFKLVVEEIWNLESRKTRRVFAQGFEQRFYRVHCLVGAKHGLSLPMDALLGHNWKEAALPVNEKEKWEIDQGKIASKVLSRKQYLMKEDPELTDEEAQKILDDIDAEAQAGAQDQLNKFKSQLNQSLMGGKE